MTVSKTWNYSGDISLEHGGTYWREDGAEDYVLAVQVTPCSDAGGPDNLFHIARGSIYLPADEARRSGALACCGYVLGKDSIVDCSGGSFPLASTEGRALLVESFLAYMGLDWPDETVIQIGRETDEAPNGWSPSPDVVLRGNANLRRRVESEFLD